MDLSKQDFTVVSKGLSKLKDIKDTGLALGSFIGKTADRTFKKTDNGVGVQLQPMQTIEMGNMFKDITLTQENKIKEYVNNKFGDRDTEFKKQVALKLYDIEKQKDKEDIEYQQNSQYKPTFGDKFGKAFKQTITKDIPKSFEQLTAPTRAAVAELPKIASNLGEIGLKYNPVIQVGNVILKSITGEDKLLKDITGIKDAGQKIKKEIQDGLGVDPNSLATKSGEFIAQLAVSLIPIIPKGTGQIGLLKEATKKYPVLYKLLSGAIQGAGGSMKIEAVTTGNITPEQTKQGAITGGVLAGAGVLAKGVTNLIGKTGERLKLSGLLNKSDVKKINKQLSSTDDIVDVAKWSEQQKLTGTKEQQINKLSDIIKNADEKLEKGLKNSPIIKEELPKEIKKTADKINKLIKGKYGFEKEQNIINKIYKGKDVTLNDINKLQKVSGELLPNFTVLGDEAAQIGAKENSKLYLKTKKFIEDKAKEYGLGIDVKSLKKIKQVGTTMKQAIEGKVEGENIKQLISPYTASGLGALYGVSKGETIEERVKNAVIYGGLGKLSQSTLLKSNLGQFLMKAPKLQQNKIIKSLNSIGTKDSVKAIQLIKNIFNENNNK